MPVPFPNLPEIVADGITEAIDHISKNVVMNCSSCSLQKVCNEVEGLKELHFGKAKNS